MTARLLRPVHLGRAADRAQRRRIVNENLPTIVMPRERERKGGKKHEGEAKSLNRAIRLSITVATVLR